MDHQSFISSGILERHVAGLASPEDEQEIRDMAEKHPAVREELDNIYQILEAFARAHAVQPPEALKQKTLQVLSEAPKTGAKVKPAPTPRAAAPERPQVEKQPVRWSAVLPALLGLALVGACAGMFLFMSEAGQAREKLAALQAEFDEYKKNSAAQMAASSGVKEEYDALLAASLRVFPLSGVKTYGQAYAVVYWNPDSQTAFLDVKNLPELPAGQAYQLWASVEGKSRFLSTIDATTKDNKLLSIPFIENPQSFYATLEAEGQTAEPSLRNVVLFGRAEKF